MLICGLIVLLVSSGAISDDTRCKSGIEGHVELNNITNYFHYRKDIFKGNSWHQISPEDVHHHMKHYKQLRNRRHNNISINEQSYQLQFPKSFFRNHNRHQKVKQWTKGQYHVNRNLENNWNGFHYKSHLESSRRMRNQSSESEEPDMQIRRKSNFVNEYDDIYQKPGRVFDFKKRHWLNKFKKTLGFSGQIERKNFVQDIIDSILGKKTTPAPVTTKTTTSPTVMPIGWLSTQDGHIPTKAFEAGRSNGLLIYVVRTVSVPTLPGFIPGNLVYGDMGSGHCSLGFFRMRRVYQILLGDVEDFRWVKLHDRGNLITSHRNIVQAGWEGTPNNLLFVCRGIVDHKLTIGKLTQDAICFAGSYLNGLEWVIEENVEVLLKKEIPPNDFLYANGPVLEQ